MGSACSSLCGREDAFDRAGEGHVLGSLSSKPSQTPAIATSPAGQAGYSVAGRNGGGGKSASTSPPQRLGGGGEAPRVGGGVDEAREARLRAAEERAKAANSRGTTGGKLSTQLNSQAKDGGRAAEARLEAERRGEQLVWD
ncbi:hypothetical protein JCM8097_005176 [Rhodosporidiobolus ruineniae]